MYTMKFKIFLLGLFSILGVLIHPQQIFAEDDNQTLNREQKTILVMRGTYAFSTGNNDEMADIFSPNYVRHEQKHLTPEAKLESISKLIKHLQKFYEVKDMQTEPLDIVVEGDKAVVRWKVDVSRLATADVTDEIPARIKFEGVTISRFESGKIAEQWVYYDSNLVLTLTRLRYKNYFEATAAAEVK